MSDDYTLRLASLDDREDIMSFIKKNWLEEHILANNISFFDYQYKFRSDIQFIIAVNSRNMIDGILGFIQYDPNNKNQDIFLAIWKVIPNLKDNMLGIKLLQYLIKNINHMYIHCVGINKSTIGVYKFLRFNTGNLDHYAAFNKECKNQIICKPPLFIKKIKLNKKFKFIKINEIKISLSKLKKCSFYEKMVPFKPLKFILHRYENHPYHSYFFYEIFEKNLFSGIAVLREVNYLNSSALRIIDIIASKENISLIINDLANLIIGTKYEYIDIYASGLDNLLLCDGNYEKISDNKNIIVPDHFSPFKKKNIEIYFTSSYSNNKIILFKGDGDQDQPRIFKN